MALVRDDCLVPTIDEPGLGYIRESSSDQYVPDVFYKVSTLGVFTCKVFVLFLFRFILFFVFCVDY